jgi:hypothetical protein
LKQYRGTNKTSFEDCCKGILVTIGGAIKPVI